MNDYENMPDILITDDNPANLHLLIEILDTKGYRTRVLQSGLQVMELVRLKPPDLILLDIMMPGISGYEVCRQLKADVRIIAATNRELRDMVRNGEMREDFFQRVHVIALEMPPLRRRKEDIPLLVTHFLDRTEAGSRMIPRELMERFRAYDWPGNVRELFNELRRYLATGEVELNGPVLEKHKEQPLGDTAILLPEGRTFQEITEAFERRVLKKALSQFDGNRTRISEQLGIPRKTLYRKLAKHRLG